MANVSPAEVQKALDGVSYPASKEELISQAKDSGASTEIMNALQALEEKQYDAVSEVQQSFTKAQA